MRYATGHSATEDEWVESFGVPAEVRATDRRLQAALDALPGSIPADACRPCECGTTFELERTTNGRPAAHLDMDGSASVGLICPGCGMQSDAYWCWDR